MKDVIKKSVLELIEKSGIELSESEQDRIIKVSFDTALEHISNALSCIPLKEGTTHTTVWIRFVRTSEIAGTRQNRAVLVAFTVPSTENNIGPVVYIAAWYDGKIIYSNCYQMEREEIFEKATALTLKAVEAKCGRAGKAFASIMTSSGLEECETNLTVPPGILDLIISGENARAIQLIDELNYSRISDLCHSDLDLINTIAEAGRVSDGVLARYASKIGSVANSMPMLIQEAKSHAAYTANELLTPYRCERARTNMIGWATW